MQTRSTDKNFEKAACPILKFLSDRCVTNSNMTDLVLLDMTVLYQVFFLEKQPYRLKIKTSYYNPYL